MKTLAAVLLAGLAFAGPAAAMTPPPTVLDFEGVPQQPSNAETLYPGSGVHLQTPCFGVTSEAAPEDGCSQVAAPGHDSPQSLQVPFGVLIARFDAGQANVSLWGAALCCSESSEANRITMEAWSGEPGTSAQLDTATVAVGDTPFGNALVVEAPPGGPKIGAVRVFTGNSSSSGNGDTLLVDDFSFGTDPQPDTAITAGPAALSRSTVAQFAFGANQIDNGFLCSLDGATALPCASPYTVSGLGQGAHTFTVAARDRYGTFDPSPAQYDWVVDLTPPAAVQPSAPSVPDADGDGVPDISDDCPGNPNAAQGDVDKDGVGDACETAPPGNVPPVDGQNVIVRVLSGDVFVKLPAGAAAARHFAAAPGFVPLKGVASLPVGTVVDASRGSLALASTVDGRRVGLGGRTQTATLSAGIFAIRQKRLKPGSSTRIPTDLVLRSTADTSRACQSTPVSGPVKGRPHNLVRSLSAHVDKGFFRVVGGAAITSGVGATWVTSDRCDGTRTDVGKGKVRVADAATNKTFTVRAGRSLLIKAALFATKVHSK